MMYDVLYAIHFIDQSACVTCDDILIKYSVCVICGVCVLLCMLNVHWYWYCCIDGSCSKLFHASDFSQSIIPCKSYYAPWEQDGWTLTTKLIADLVMIRLTVCSLCYHRLDEFLWDMIYRCMYVGIHLCWYLLTYNKCALNMKLYKKRIKVETVLTLTLMTIFPRCLFLLHPGIFYNKINNVQKKVLNACGCKRSSSHCQWQEKHIMYVCFTSLERLSEHTWTDIRWISCRWKLLRSSRVIAIDWWCRRILMAWTHMRMHCR